MRLNIEQLLANEGIDSNKLMPRHPDLQHPQTIEQGHDPLFPIYLPLKVSCTAMVAEKWWSEPQGKLKESHDKGDSHFSHRHPFVT